MTEHNIEADIATETSIVNTTTSLTQTNATNNNIGIAIIQTIGANTDSETTNTDEIIDSTINTLNNMLIGKILYGNNVSIEFI